MLGSTLAVGPAQAATFTVDRTDDLGDINIGNGSCSVGGAPPRCTLRAAIQEANFTVGADIIDFNIGGGGAQTIVLTGNLPDITRPVIINGATQPGFAGTPLIEVNAAGAPNDTLDVQGGGSGSTIRALCINRSPASAIRLLGSNNVIAGNFLGTNLAGDTTAGFGNLVGININTGAATNNLVGGTAAADRNIISGNTVDGIQINGASNNLIQGNYIGTDVSGNLDRGNTNQGIAVFAASTNNTIGGTVLGAGNVISGNGQRGIEIQEIGTTGNVVQGNRIGTNFDGTAGIPNSLVGVSVAWGATNNTIGGIAAGAGNLIAYNTGDGIHVVQTVDPTVSNAILGNSFHSNGALGIDLADNGVTANDLGDTDTGPNNRQNFPVLSAAVTNGAGSAHFAGSLNGAASTAYRIEFFASTATDPSGFGEGQRYLGFTNVTTNAAGYAIIGATLTVGLTAGEYVTATATDPSNSTSEFSAAIPAYGALIVTTTADTVDGNTASVSVLIATPGADGRISLREAILATNGTAGTDTIRFGIPLTDANRLYYRDDAIAASLTNVQATALADSATPSSPAITDFDPDYPAGLSRSWYRIQPPSLLPSITDTLVLDGTTQPGYVAGGPVIELVGASNGTGGAARCFFLSASATATTIRGLVINQWGGEAVTSAAASTVVQGNYVGTDPSGTLAQGNGRSGISAGVYFSGAGGQIGGLTLADRNVISSNLAVGIVIDANNVLIQGNYVGTNVTGAASLGNAFSGIVLSAVNSPTVSNVTIGGVAAGSRNVISGNGNTGVQLTGATVQNNVVQGNYVGTNAAGTASLANSQHGIRISSGAANNTVGGTTLAERNVISGNGGQGVRIDSLNTNNNVIAGNFIGTNAAGIAGIGNSSGGIAITNSPANNTIGGAAPGAGNVIAYNTTYGINVAVAAGTGNSILGNAIHSNTGLGIDLLNDGVTANDPLDADSGPNDLLNFPLITAVYASGGNLTVHIKLDVPAGSYRIEFFRNPSGADPSTFGEGEVYAGSSNVTHLGGGAFFFNQTVPGNIGDVITATTTACTDGAVCAAFGSTSEFAKALPATTAVTLMSFTATPADGAVDLSWATASELQNLGFHLYRSDSAGGTYTRITSSLLPGLGSSPTGQSYAYRDGGLVNGRRYYYELEDVETTGRTKRHGPVSAIPTAAGSPPPDPAPGPSGTSYGDPSSVTLREVERSPQHVVLELLTGGFVSSPAEEGHVRLSIPAFESVSQPGEPELPMRRALVEAVAGKRVRLASVLASDVLRFPGLRPVSEGNRGIEVSEDGTVLASRRATREGPAFRRLFPSESARLEGTSFQEETKKVEVLFFPLRWDGSGLVLSRRLRVRLEFSGPEESERSRGGSRGRRAVRRGSHSRSGALAQIVAKERGLYRVTYEDLFSTRGRRATSGLRLSRQGESVAFHVEPGGAVFGPGSSLYFLGEGSSLNPYGDAVYELETNTRGLSMAVERLSPTSGVIGEYFETLRKEENRYYQAGLLDAPDLWLWDIVVSPGSKSYAFTVDQLSASSSAGRLVVELQGASDFEGVQDHHVKVRVNGTFVGEASWDGRLPKALEMEVSAGILQEGPNALEIQDVGDTGAAYSMVFLNRFSLSYPRRLVASQGTLEGWFDASGQAEVGGVSASSFLLDTTRVPRWLVGARATPNGLSFPVQAGKSYLVVSSVLRPEVKLLEPSSLKSETNQADYLLLAPKAFLPAAQPLLELRQSQGLVTKAVSLEEVFEQFGHGEISPLAIKEFLEYAYHFWAIPSPRYVLLLGDASYDPKDYLKTGVKDWLPGFPVKTSYLWTVSDPAYAAVNGEDLLPDLALGRLPASSVAEAERLIQKVLLFEGGGGDFRGQAVLVADNADRAGNFEADANEIASTLLASRNPRKIYYSLEGANSRTMIKEAFDEGASLMSYVGHGGTVIWASENIFNFQDVNSLALQPQQPLLLTLNCLNGFFHFPPLNSLSEALLKAEGKGVIGAFSPSGLSVNDAAHLFHKAILQEILSGRHERLGDAVLAAQKTYVDSGAFPELLSIYNLFGDPALRLR